MCPGCGLARTLRCSWFRTSSTAASCSEVRFAQGVNLLVPSPGGHSWRPWVTAVFRPFWHRRGTLPGCKLLAPRSSLAGEAQREWLAETCPQGVRGLAPFAPGLLPWAVVALGPCERRMTMANKTVVLAIFNDEASADTAADALKKSGVAHHDAIGVLALNEKGEVKAHKVGKRSVGLGIGIGLVLALFSP